VGPAALRPSAIKSAPDSPCKSRADGAKARKSAGYAPKKCEVKNWDKAERIQVDDFDRIDMPRWIDVTSYGADNGANGTTKSVKEHI
jgi:hypothetical protein